MKSSFGTKNFITNLLLFLLLIYFIFHAVYGNKGIIKYFFLIGRLEKASNELQFLKANRIELEHRVTLLRPKSLDKDMLDEETRRILGVASAKEKIFIPTSLNKTD